MSATQSNLSQYGYDFVVATTQAGINATMEELMNANAQTTPEVIVCYAYDSNNESTLIDYATLVSNANGTDPFTVGPNPTAQQLQDLSAAGFNYGFKAKLGLPPGYAPLTPGGPALPNVVTLGSNSESVTYNLMCSEFTVAEISYGPRGSATFFSASQPDGDAWIFTSTINLSTLEYGPSVGNVKLSTEAQNKIQQLSTSGAAFSAQLLMFDFDNAILESQPTISGIDQGGELYTFLLGKFLGVYFSQLKLDGQPVLNCGITQPTAPQYPVPLSAVNIEANPYLDGNGQVITSPSDAQLDAATLSYLCASNGDALPAPTSFTWNWVDTTESSEYEGIVAINRNFLVGYMQNAIMPYVSNACLAASVDVSMDGIYVDYNWGVTAGQTPSVSLPSTGSEVIALSYSSSASDDAGLDGDMGAMTLSPSYNASVSFSGNTIVIVQNLQMYVSVRSLQTTASWNAINKTITDTYTISVDQNGNLTATLTSNTANNPEPTPSSNWFIDAFTDINTLASDIAQWANQVASISLTDIPVSIDRNCVFPGGNTFTYCDVEFSDNQDLVSHINYAQPI